MDANDQVGGNAGRGALRIFIGYDPRQPVAYNVLQHSIIRHSSRPVAITPLILAQLPITRRGLTEFTYSRFLVPWLCGYQGVALFLDADMVVKGDIAELFREFDMGERGSDVGMMIEQTDFEWASLILFNCARCTGLTPEYVQKREHPMFDMKWARGIQGLPSVWNHCVGYMSAKPAKLYHYTQGIPVWPETKDLEPAPFIEEAKSMMSTVSWQDLMGNSVHAEHVRARLNRSVDVTIVPSGTGETSRDRELRDGLDPVRPDGVGDPEAHGGHAPPGLRLRE